MTAEFYLNQAAAAESRAVVLKEKIEEIETALTRATADPSRETVGGSKPPGFNDGMIDKLGELRAGLIRSNAEAIILRATIAMEISALDEGNYIKILNLRYLERDKFGRRLMWKEIAKRTGYSLNNCYKLHNEALAEFSKKYSSKLESGKW